MKILIKLYQCFSQKLSLSFSVKLSLSLPVSNIIISVITNGMDSKYHKLHMVDMGCKEKAYRPRLHQI